MGKEYLINKILRRIENNKGFIEIKDYPNYNNLHEKQDFYSEIEVIKYNKSNIILNIHKMEHSIGDYDLNYYILDNIILEVSEKIKTKNYYFVEETMYDNLCDIMIKKELIGVNWFVTMDTHMILTEITNKIYKNEWTNLEIGDNKINTLECNFPKDVIFGTKYPIIINKTEIYEVAENDNMDTINGINIPFHYIDDFYAIRMITDEKKKKLFLRDIKIRKLRK
jgi:hypothetical protein